MEPCALMIEIRTRVGYGLSACVPSSTSLARHTCCMHRKHFYFYFLSPFSSPYPRPHHGCMLCHELHLLHLTPQKKERKKTHNFLPNILSLDSTCSFLIIFYSVVARIAGTEPCIILLKKSPIPKLALIWLKLASCSCLRYVYFQPRPQAWRL